MKLKNTTALLLCTLVAAIPTFAQLNLGDLLSKGLQTLQNATASTSFTAEELVGTWNYVSPAVSFKGDGALANIGGAAAATPIESKLAPYFQKAGINNSQLVVNEDLSFSWKISSVKLTGTIEKTEGSNLVFNFKAFGKVKIGKIECVATKSGSTVSLTFDSSKILSLAQQVASVASNSTFKTVNSLLSNYKDLYVGIKVKKTAE